MAQTVKGLKEVLDKLEQSINVKFSKLESSVADLEKKLDNSDIIHKIEAVSTSLTQKIDNDSNIIKKDILEIRNVIISRLLTENRVLRNHVKSLSMRMVDMERNFNNSQQNSRKNNVEVDGIPSSVDQSSLKPTVVNVFNHMGVKCTSNEIKVVHRLPGKKDPKPVIVRARRDFLEQVASKRKNLKDKDFTSLGFPPGSAIFINSNLSKQMRQLSYNCRQLKKANVIQETWVFNGSLKIKTNDEKIVTIAHEMDLFRLFPSYEGFTFDTSLCKYVLCEETDIEAENDLYGHC